MHPIIQLSIAQLPVIIMQFPVTIAQLSIVQLPVPIKQFPVAHCSRM